MLHAIRATTHSEARLLLRDRSALVMPLLVPLAVLVAWGSVSDMRVPATELGGATPLQAIIAPIAVAIAVASLGLSTLPVALASRRETGVLRRLAVTPVGALPLLAGHLLVNVVLLVVSIAVAVVGGALLVGVGLPPDLVSFTGVVVLAATASFAIGLVIAARAATTSAATAISTGVFFPMMLLGGMIVPRESLPEIVGRIGAVTPVGATVDALRATWTGVAPSVTSLVVLVATVVVGLVVAVVTFRWS